MTLFLAVEILIIFDGLMIILGHPGLANKFFIGTFFLIFLAVFMYLIKLTNNDKK